MAAIFGKKKKDKVEEAPKEVVKQSSESKKTAPIVSSDFKNPLLSPRITEKASERAMNGNAYVFNVDQRATKKDISKAVSKIYKVSPVKVSVVRIPRKQIVVRGKKGMRPGGKKAYVYLKDGDKIEFV